ncbi:hypothetical protein ACWDOP_18570 [Nocardia sp. NPDC003693]
MSGVLLMTAGSGALTVATATAAPAGVVQVQNPSFPNPGMPGPQQQQPKDKNTEKAESLGGGVANKVIDTVAGLVKCGLNFALPTVKCTI